MNFHAISLTLLIPLTVLVQQVSAMGDETNDRSCQTLLSIVASGQMPEKIHQGIMSQFFLHPLLINPRAGDGISSVELQPVLSGDEIVAELQWVGGEKKDLRLRPLRGHPEMARYFQGILKSGEVPKNTPVSFLQEKLIIYWVSETLTAPARGNRRSFTQHFFFHFSLYADKMEIFLVREAQGSSRKQLRNFVLRPL